MSTKADAFSLYIEHNVMSQYQYSSSSLWQLHAKHRNTLTWNTLYSCHPNW